MLHFKHGNEINFSKKSPNKPKNTRHLADRVVSNNHSTNVLVNLWPRGPSEVNSWLVTILGVKRNVIFPIASAIFTILNQPLPYVFIFLFVLSFCLKHPFCCFWQQFVSSCWGGTRNVMYFFCRYLLLWFTR